MGEEIAISLKNISKCYKRYARPVDRLKEILLPGKSRADTFWALQDISFDIYKGQTIGIVGKNGSGKSTLLQIIAGTLTPTTGDIQINGRVAALLELGSGFNLEFTGRQNIFFNAQLLGLKKEEIIAKFDDIVAFADIGDFIDQPVKTYSSGMFVRLAFAVATSTTPDILIVDEALSVGDEAFQRKCFARIQSIQEQGGTILFVSHSASSIVELCKSAILMHHGELLLSASPKIVVSKYQKLIYAPTDQLERLQQEIRDLNNYHSVHEGKNLSILHGIEEKQNHQETKKQESLSQYDPNLIPKSTISYISRGAKIENSHITTLDGKLVNILCARHKYIYKYQVSFINTAYRVRFGMLIKTVSGLELGGAVSHTTCQPIEYLDKGAIVEVEFKFNCLLQPGVYFLNAGVVGNVDGSEQFLDRHIDIAMFRVQPENDNLATGIIDFCIEPDISFAKNNQNSKSASSIK
ncbi:MAG: ABC transporter ATP-binding protein [Trichormus sp. ATA11-4-KO1]|jgi:lipopolysaccharide transport system ATP-binding protein|nr:ABC transporter ATP-binding protein [Trichormus sp. ATA11-4-KO1]